MQWQLHLDVYSVSESEAAAEPPLGVRLSQSQALACRLTSRSLPFNESAHWQWGSVRFEFQSRADLWTLTGSPSTRLSVKAPIGLLNDTLPLQSNCSGCFHTLLRWRAAVGAPCNAERTWLREATFDYALRLGRQLPHRGLIRAATKTRMNSTVKTKASNTNRQASFGKSLFKNNIWCGAVQAFRRDRFAASLLPVCWLALHQVCLLCGFYHQIMDPNFKPLFSSSCFQVLISLPLQCHRAACAFRLMEDAQS